MSNQVNFVPLRDAVTQIHEGSRAIRHTVPKVALRAALLSGVGGLVGFLASKNSIGIGFTAVAALSGGVFLCHKKVSDLAIPMLMGEKAETVSEEMDKVVHTGTKKDVIRERQLAQEGLKRVAIEALEELCQESDQAIAEAQQKRESDQRGVPEPLLSEEGKKFVREEIEKMEYSEAVVSSEVAPFYEKILDEILSELEDLKEPGQDKELVENDGVLEKEEELFDSFADIPPFSSTRNS